MINYLLRNKFITIHLLLKTKSIGVNNKWSDNAIKNSIFGKSLVKQLFSLIFIYPIITNYRHIKWRMGTSVGFVSKEEYKMCFKKNNKISVL